jgi:hypothetical protein
LDNTLSSGSITFDGAAYPATFKAPFSDVVPNVWFGDAVVETVLASPPDACSPIILAEGQIVVVEEGGSCTPLEKANHVREAGGFAAVLTSAEVYSFVHEGVDPPILLMDISRPEGTEPSLFWSLRLFA